MKKNMKIMIIALLILIWGTAITTFDQKLPGDWGFQNQSNDINYLM